MVRILLHLDKKDRLLEYGPQLLVHKRTNQTRKNESEDEKNESGENQKIRWIRRGEKDGFGEMSTLNVS